MSEQPSPWRNRLSFGLGTLGRDMVGALVSMYLMYYLTDILDISGGAVVAVTAILVVMRIFDAVNDPVMGLIVDNTRTRWGKFKPWIVLGALLWAGTTLVMFIEPGFRGTAFLVVFTLVYLAWEISYTINDISFYGMLPSLSRSQPERERIGVVARICANVGLFAVVVGVLPATNALGAAVGDAQRGWFVFALICVLIMLVFSSLTIAFTRQQVEVPAEHTPIRELVRVITGNDQLLWTTASMLIFMAGYMTTTSLGVYYFKYVFGDEGAYPIFAAILGVTQLTGLAIFPLVSIRLPRARIHTLAVVLCLIGLAVLWAAGSSMIVVGVAGVALFTGQAFIQLLMLMFIADCVEYGEWKLGRRNESITVALQPFIYKGSNALGSAFVGLALVWSGISDASGPADLGPGDVTVFKVVMMGIPMVLMALSWVILRRTYRLDEATYAGIVADLQAREAREATDGQATI